jgi:hypothetical protein
MGRLEKQPLGPAAAGRIIHAFGDRAPEAFANKKQARFLRKRACYLLFGSEFRPQEKQSFASSFIFADVFLHNRTAPAPSDDHPPKASQQ